MKKLEPYAVALTGLHLIEASAGTGKTHAITSIYLRAVVELGFLPEQILVVTFTRAATGELRERIRARLRAAASHLAGEGASVDPATAGYLDAQVDRDRCRLRLTRALLVIDQASVMTIHGFCAKVLEQNAFESRMPFGTELVESLDPMLDEVVNDFVVSHLAVAPEDELRALRSIGVCPEQLRALGQFVLAHDNLLLEPDLGAPEVELSVALRELDVCRNRSRRWLDEVENLRNLAGLNKTKPPGTLGKRLADHVAKTTAWLEAPLHGLRQDCESFGRFYELAEKYPEAKTQNLLEWFDGLAACSGAYEKLRRATLELGVRWRRRFIEFLRREVESRKATRNVQTYDDLLRRLRDSLVGGAGATLAQALRERYPLALIDEFQDTDPIQFDVFSRIYGAGASLFLIGDPKQSIYAFRGADVDNYLAAKHDRRVRGHTLDVNWRSDPLLLANVESLYREHADPFFGAGIEFVPVAPRPGATDLVTETGPLSGVRLVLPHPSDVAGEKAPSKRRARQVAMAVAVEHIQQLLTMTPTGWARQIRAADIAVLGRTNRECEAMANALRASGIRCVSTTDSSVLDSAAAGSLVLFLRALLAPKDPKSVTALLLDAFGGVSPRGVEALKTDAEAWDRWVELLYGYRKLWERSGVLAAVVRASGELQLKERLFRQASGERFITDLLHVAELLHAAAKAQHLSEEGQLDWLLRARAGEAECPTEDQQLRIEADSDAVLLTTVHRSKGLEFAFVVCPFLWDGGARRRSPYLSYKKRLEGQDKTSTVLHLEPQLLAEEDPALEAVETERLQESARLLYVALTRAKHQVALVWVDAAGCERSALRRLLSGRTELGVTPADHLAMAGPTPSPDLLSVAPSPRVYAEQLRSRDVPSDLLQGERASKLVPPTALERVVKAKVNTTSYSALTATTTPHAEVGRDVDAMLPDTALANLERDEHRGSEGSRALAAEPLTLPLIELPAGPRTGEALHSILEHADFQQFKRDGGEPDVAQVLERFGLDGKRFDAKVRAGLCGVLDTQLHPDDPELRLARVAAAQKKSEFEFLMKVSALSVERLVARLDPEVSGLGADYSEDVGRLRFDPVSGYLRGFIDLVFEHRGRYYLVDYKSNALGDTVEDFEPERLKAEMRRHHYPVQAAIYAAAVDRWLRVTRRGYVFEQHFGGIFYLFLRGMVPELGFRNGIFFHRPPEKALRDFESMLEGGVVA